MLKKEEIIKKLRKLGWVLDETNYCPTLQKIDDDVPDEDPIFEIDLYKGGEFFLDILNSDFINNFSFTFEEAELFNELSKILWEDPYRANR